MTRVTIYSTDRCPYCVHAKSLLADHGIEFEEINLSKDTAGRSELAEKTGMMTFPQILIDGELIGGFQQLIEATAAGRLEELEPSTAQSL